MAVETLNILDKAPGEPGRGDVGREQLRRFGDERGDVLGFRARFGFGPRQRQFGRGGSGIEREQCIGLGREPPGLVRGGEAGERSWRGAVVFGRIRQLVIHVLGPHRFDAAFAVENALGDQHAVAARVMEIGEIGFGHRDRKGRMARQTGEANFRFELVLAPVAEGIVEAARELGEQFCVQRRIGLRIFDREQQLVARIAGRRTPRGE